MQSACPVLPQNDDKDSQTSRSESIHEETTSARKFPKNEIGTPTTPTISDTPTQKEAAETTICPTPRKMKVAIEPYR